MKKKRISSFVYWLLPVFIDVIFLFLFIKFLLVYLNFKDKTAVVISISIFFFWLVFRFTYRFKTVFIDENFLYIFKYLGLKKIELKDVKSIKQKEIFPFKITNTFIVEYLDDDLNIRLFQFYGSFSNKKDLENFISNI